MDFNFETLFASQEKKWTEDQNIKGDPHNNDQSTYLFSQNSFLYLEELLELDDSKQPVFNVSSLHQGLYHLHQ